MKANFLIRESIQALRSNLLRSLLTIIGIIVGIFSVTAMLALGEGLSQNVLSRFSSFAQGDLSISGDVVYSDFAWITARPYVEHTFATLQLSRISVVAGGSDFTPTIQSIVGDYSEILKYEIVSGSVFDFHDKDFHENVAVVSNGFNDAVVKETGKTVLDQSIIIQGLSYRVIGIIKSNSMTFTRGDGLILLPYSTMVGNLSSTGSFSTVAVVLKDSSLFDVAGKNILEGLNSSRQLASDSDTVFTIETSQAFIESAQQTTQMISLFLGIVGSIALFVGGIGTMNMMLTTVTERTREIGLRKAVGARDRDILLQILIESILLTSFGGLLGILLSLGAAKIANQVFADSPLISVIVNIKVIMLATAVSFSVGIVFGLYPARNASKLQPVDALRTE